MVEVQKLRTFYDFYHARATLCGDSHGRGSKTEDFLRFLSCARNPLRRFAWSRFKKLRTFYDFCQPRATLCGVSKRSRCAAVRICCSRNGLFKAQRSFHFTLRSIPLTPLSQSRGRGFDSPLVRGSSGLKIAAFKYKRSTRSVLLQPLLENRNF